MSSVHSSNDTRIYLKEVKSLRKAAYDVVFLNPDRDGEDESGVRFVRIDMPRGRLKRMFASSLKLYKQAMREDADVYHFHDPELLPTGLLLRMKDKEVIYDVHEDVPRQILSKDYIKPFLREPIAEAFGFFEKFCARRFTMNITAGRPISEVFLKHNCEALTINNYPVLEEFTAEPRRRPSDRVAYVGEIAAIRGIFELTEAIGRSRATLELVGRFEDDGLAEKVRATKGWERVNYHGQQDRRQVAKILARSSAGIVTYLPEPSHINAQPNKLFEYMAAGIPVIASDFQLWKSIVEGGECGVCVNPHDPAEIARAIDYLTDNPEDAEKMGKNGRRLALTKYNWATEERKLIGLYRDLLDGNGARELQEIP